MKDRVLVEVSTLLYVGGLLLLWLFILRDLRSAQTRIRHADRWLFVVLVFLTVAVLGNVFLIRRYR